MRKFVTALWALMVAAIAAVIMLIPFVPAVGTMIADFTEFMADNLPFASIAALILGLSLWVFFAQFRSAKPQMPSSVVLQAGRRSSHCWPGDTLIDRQLTRLRASASKAKLLPLPGRV